MPEWLDANTWAVWLGLAFVLGVVEAATVDLVFLMLAGGAIAGAIASLTPLGLVAQVLIAVAVASGLMLGVRPLAKKRLGGADEGPFGTDRYLGKVGVATEEVSDHGGLVLVDGEVWSSRAAHDDDVIPAGHEVKITEVRGATLVVTPEPPVQDIITRGK